MNLFGIIQLNDEAVQDEGDFHLDYAIKNGIFGLVMGIFLVYPLMYYMKYGNRFL